MRICVALPIIFWIHTSAQPVYELPVQAGQEFLLRRLVAPTAIVQLTDGEDQTWDLSGLPPGTIVMCSFADAAESDLHVAFPEADVFRTLGTDQELYDISGGAVDIVGELFGGDIRAYSDPARLMETPFTYGSSWSDQFAEEWSASGIDFLAEGSLTSNVIGYGTLQLPGATFENALLVREQQDIVFSQDGDANNLTRYTDRIWVNGLSQPLVQSLRSVQMYGSDTIADVYRVYIVQTILASVENLAQRPLVLFAAPNPCSEGARLRSFDGTRYVSATLYDATGRSVRKIDHVCQDAWLDTSSLAEGTYVLRVSTESGAQLEIRISVVHP